MSKILSFIKNHKIPILLFSVSLSLSLLFIILGRQWLLLRFLSLIFLFCTAGLGLAVFLRKVFVFKDILGLLGNSFAMGSLFSALTILASGLMGIKYSDRFLFILAILLVIVSFILLVQKENDYYLGIYRKVKCSWVDIIFGLIILLFLFFIFIFAIENYSPNWDSFTFWAVDSKYLFEFRTLRNNTFDILRDQAYSSLYPIYLFLEYRFFGGIYEQFSSLITIFFAFLSSFILWNRIRQNKETRKKLLSYLTLLLVLFSFASLQNILISQYADVFCAFLVLLITLILLTSKAEASSYKWRFLLLSNLIFSLFLVKEPYWTVSFALGFVWVVIDFAYVKKNIKTLLKDKSLWLVLGIQISFIIGNLVYSSQFNSPSQIDSLKTGFHGISEYITYLYEIFTMIAENLPYILILISIVLGVIILNYSYKKRQINLMLIFFSVFLLPIFYYVIKLQSLTSLSLLRYISLIFFLIPVVILESEPQTKNIKFSNILPIVLTLCLSGYIVSLSYIRYMGDLVINTHSGCYKDFQFQQESADQADQVKNLIKPADKVLIVDKVNNGLGNMATPAIYVRYYLFEQSVGGQYSVSIEGLDGIIQKEQPDYILILGYDDYWNCSNNILQTNKSYLIPTKNFSADKGCPVTDAKYLRILN